MEYMREALKALRDGMGSDDTDYKVLCMEIAAVHILRFMKGEHEGAFPDLVASLSSLIPKDD